MRYQNQKKYFENLLRDGLSDHAYLFIGQDSANKSIFAEELCALFTGRNFKNNPDLKLIRPNAKEDKYRIDITSIRELKSFMSLKPYSGGYKVAVIEDAEAISIEAANAMLKVLEEPPKHSVLVLLSSKPKLLPRTILSRCETVVFPPEPDIETDEMRQAIMDLRKAAKQSMAGRIKYAKQLYEKEDYAVLVDLWLKSLRFRLGSEPRVAPVLKKLLYLSRIVSQPQYNHRIALENFFVNL